VAATVAAAAGSATLIGDPAKIRAFGLSGAPGPHSRRGPLGGIETALSYTAADWNLVLACDMPAISAEFLRGLLDAAERAGTPTPWCLPALPDAWSRSAPSTTGAACGRSAARWMRACERSQMRWPVWKWRAGRDDAACFENLNTPEEWACL
jgi:molybdopterin-guanine dinucleotide biosynthesis protein A